MEIVKNKLLCKKFQDTSKFFVSGEHSFERIIIHWTRGFKQKQDLKSMKLEDFYSVTLELDELIQKGWAKGMEFYYDDIPVRPSVNIVAVYDDTVYFNVGQREKKPGKEFYGYTYTLWEMNAGETKNIVQKISDPGNPEADIYFAVTTAHRPEYALTLESAAKLKKFEVRGTPSFDGIGYWTGYTGLGGSNSSGFHYERDEKLKLETIKERGLTVCDERGYHLPDVSVLAVEDDIIYVRAGNEVTRFFAGEEFEFLGPSFTYDTAGCTILCALRNGEPLAKTIRSLRHT